MDAYLRARVCVYIYIHIFDRSSNSQRSSHRTFISLRTFSLEKSPLFLVDSRKHVNTYLLSYNGSVRAPGSLFFYFFTLFSPPVSLPLSLVLHFFFNLIFICIIIIIIIININFFYVFTTPLMYTCPLEIAYITLFEVTSSLILLLLLLLLLLFLLLIIIVFN